MEHIDKVEIGCQVPMLNHRVYISHPLGYFPPHLCKIVLHIMHLQSRNVEKSNLSAFSFLLCIGHMREVVKKK